MSPFPLQGLVQLDLPLSTASLSLRVMSVVEVEFTEQQYFFSLPVLNLTSGLFICGGVLGNNKDS